MKKLTAEKCRSVIQGFKWMAAEGPGMSIRDEYDIQAYEHALKALEQQERGDSGWIEWGGGASGSCPVAYATLVEVKSRNGHVAEDCAEAFEWCHEADDDDIIAYRIIQEQPTNQNGEQ